MDKLSCKFKCHYQHIIYRGLLLPFLHGQHCYYSVMFLLTNMYRYLTETYMTDPHTHIASPILGRLSAPAVFRQHKFIFKFTDFLGDLTVFPSCWNSQFPPHPEYPQILMWAKYILGCSNLAFGMFRYNKSVQLEHIQILIQLNFLALHIPSGICKGKKCSSSLGNRNLKV